MSLARGSASMACNINQVLAPGESEQRKREMRVHINSLCNQFRSADKDRLSMEVAHQGEMIHGGR
jgi:hypothetical protein